MNYRFPDSLIIQFAKEPLPGQVKTRMQPILSAQQCVQLHEALVLHTLQRQLSAAIAPVRLDVAGNPRHPFFHRLARQYGVCVTPQRGVDLGERMYRAFSSALAENQAVVLLGSDCPALNAGHAARALEILYLGVDAVFVPALDGGYALIGLRRVVRHLFDEIDWGTDKVMAQTSQRLKDLDWQWRELPAEADIDLPQHIEIISKYPGLGASVQVGQ